MGAGGHWNRGGRRSGGDRPVKLGEPHAQTQVEQSLKSLQCHEGRHAECLGTCKPFFPGNCTCRCHRPDACPQCDSGDVTAAYRLPPGSWKCQSCGAVWRTKGA